MVSSDTRPAATAVARVTPALPTQTVPARHRSSTATPAPRRPAASGRRLTTGAPAIVLAGLAWSTNGLAKSFLPAGVNPMAIGAARLAAGGALFLLISRPALVRGLLADRRARLAVASASACMAAYQVLYFSAMHLAGVAIGTVVSMGSAPVFAGLCTLTTSRRRPSCRWLAATALALAGTAALVLGDGRQHCATTAGVLCGLGAGAVYALFTAASSAMIRRGADSRAVMAVVFAGAGVLASPALFGCGAGWLATGRGGSVVAYLAVIATVGAYVLYGRGLRTTPVATAGTLTLAEPASAALIGIALLHEPATGRSVLGLGFVAVALVTLSTQGRRGRGRHRRGSPLPGVSIAGGLHCRGSPLPGAR